MKKISAQKGLEIIRKSKSYQILVQSYRCWRRFSVQEKRRAIKRILLEVKNLGERIIPSIRKRIIEGEIPLFEEGIRSLTPFIVLWPLIEQGDLII